MSVLKEGTLAKRAVSGTVKNWKKRRIVLQAHSIAWFDGEEMKGEISLTPSTICSAVDASRSKRSSLSGSLGMGGKQLEVTTEGRSLMLSVP